LATRLGQVEADTAQLAARLDDLEGLLADVTRGPDSKGFETLTFSGMNVQVVDGTGDTACTHLTGGLHEPCNGLGNLIVGYNEDTVAVGTREGEEPRTGAHNLIVGDENGWTAYGGVENIISDGACTNPSGCEQ